MRIGNLLLAVWLILTSLTVLAGLSIPSRDVVMGVIALLAGIFLLVGR